MEIRKTAKQKNFIFDKDFYTVVEIGEMLRRREIWYFGDNCHPSYDPTITERKLTSVSDLPTMHISGDDLTDLNIRIIDGFYNVTATGKNGKEYRVKLL